MSALVYTIVRLYTAGGALEILGARFNEDDVAIEVVAASGDGATEATVSLDADDARAFAEILTAHADELEQWIATGASISRQVTAS